MYIAGSNITVGSEITGNPVKDLSCVYDRVEEGLPVYEVTKSQNGYRVLKEITQKEIKKAIEKKYKRLDIAIFFKSLADVKKVYELKTPLKRSSEYSLCYAVRSGNLNIVKAVMESGELDLSEYYNKEALEVACELGYIDIVKYLLKSGLNPCDRQFYPLIWARKAGNQELIDILEKDIKKRLGSVPEIKDPYEELLEKRKLDIQTQKVDIEPEKVDIQEEKVSGRGSVKAKLPKAPKKPKEPKPVKPKKEVKSLAELKALSAKLLKDKEKKKVKEKPVKKEEPKKPEKKKILSLEELKARSKKLLGDKK